MTFETLLLDFMARVNDATKSDGSDADRLKKVRDAKRWAEDQYSEITNRQHAGIASPQS